MNAILVFAMPEVWKAQPSVLPIGTAADILDFLHHAPGLLFLLVCRLSSHSVLAGTETCSYHPETVKLNYIPDISIVQR